MPSRASGVGQDMIPGDLRVIHPHASKSFSARGFRSARRGLPRRVV